MSEVYSTMKYEAAFCNMYFMDFDQNKLNFD